MVSQALARGHQVIAVARHPNVAAVQDARLASVASDVLDQDSVIQALAGADSVVSALGIGASRDPTVVYSQGTANILRAMDVHAIRKLAVISAAPVGPRTEQPLLQRRIVMPILERIFGATYHDMRRMEAELERSELDWVSLRPPRLLDKPATGSYRICRGVPGSSVHFTILPLNAGWLRPSKRTVSALKLRRPQCRTGHWTVATQLSAGSPMTSAGSAFAA